MVVSFRPTRQDLIEFGMEDCPMRCAQGVGRPCGMPYYALGGAGVSCFWEGATMVAGGWEALRWPSQGF
jgi:hypothetical protein